MVWLLSSNPAACVDQMEAPESSSMPEEDGAHAGTREESNQEEALGPIDPLAIHKVCIERRTDRGNCFGFRQTTSYERDPFPKSVKFVDKA